MGANTAGPWNLGRNNNVDKKRSSRGDSSGLHNRGPFFDTQIENKDAIAGKSGGGNRRKLL